jgi:hypothetical protein
MGVYQSTSNQQYEAEHGEPDVLNADGLFEIDDATESWIHNSYALVPCHTSEAEQSGLHFACTIQDEDTLNEMCQRLADDEITAVAVDVANGDYRRVYVRYYTPSYRAGGQWLRVQSRDRETGKFCKGQTW